MVESELFVVTCVVSTVEDEDDKEKKLRKLEVIKLLAQFQQPELWQHVKDNILEDGKLNISHVATEQHIPHLVTFLESGMAADDLTSLL